jgi:hypothetical protein
LGCNQLGEILSEVTVLLSKDELFSILEPNKYRDHTIESHGKIKKHEFRTEIQIKR